MTNVQESKSLTPAEQELARLVVSSLNIEGVQAESIDPEAALFGEGDLGLDSIDALELALAVSRHYGFLLRWYNLEIRKILGCLRALSANIEQQRAR